MIMNIDNAIHAMNTNTEAQKILSKMSFPVAAPRSADTHIVAMVKISMNANGLSNICVCLTAIGETCVCGLFHQPNAGIVCVIITRTEVVDVDVVFALRVFNSLVVLLAMWAGKFLLFADVIMI